MRLLPALLALLFSVVAPLRAEGLDPLQRRQVVDILRDALRSDPSILRDAIAALQADDAHTQQQSASAALARLGPTLVDPADPIQGNPKAALTIVEFYDTRCPYCRTMLPTLAELLRTDPDVRLVLKDLPILGPASLQESRLLLAAQAQDGYTRLQQAMMQSTTPPTPDSLRTMSEAVGLDHDRLLRDSEAPSIAARLKTNAQMAQQLGIDGTPALIIGDRVMAGAADLPELRAAIATARSKP